MKMPPSSVIVLIAQTKSIQRVWGFQLKNFLAMAPYVVSGSTLYITFWSATGLYRRGSLQTNHSIQNTPNREAPKAITPGGFIYTSVTLKSFEHWGGYSFVSSYTLLLLVVVSILLSTLQYKPYTHQAGQTYQAIYNYDHSSMGCSSRSISFTTTLSGMK